MAWLGSVGLTYCVEDAILLLEDLLLGELPPVVDVDKEVMLPDLSVTVVSLAQRQVPSLPSIVLPHRLIGL